MYVTSFEQLAEKRGIEKGIVQGREQGIEQGIEKSIIALISGRFGETPSDLQAAIIELDDEAVLFDILLRVPYVEDITAVWSLLPSSDE